VNSPFLKALKGEKPEYTPVRFMRQAGRFLPQYRAIRAKHKDFFELCRNVEASIEITALPVKLLGVDAAILFSDLLVPLLPLKNMEVALQERIGPVIATKVPLTAPEKLFHNYQVREELKFVADIVAGFKEEYPDVPLQVDANAAYTFLDAPRLARLDDYNLLMIEQPFYYDDLLWHADFQSMIHTPVCLDESVKNPHHAMEALRLDAARVINVKPGRVGGIGPSLEIHRLWSLSAGRPIWIGGMLETGVGRGHLVALGTLPGVRYPSDISASSRYYEEDIVDEPWELSKGSVLIARERPGIGVEVDYDKLSKYVRRTKTFTVS
jgi:L-alanine-DL-glutamate epimerase-like enolase superfamily enzyme